jgi:hypothetical protein
LVIGAWSAARDRSTVLVLSGVVAQAAAGD